MKYAFFPGCVSRGGCAELYPSSIQVCERLGLELEVMEGASCTVAGVLQEKNQKLGDTLNARTFAMAEAMGLPIMTICSTCQGTMSQAHKRLNDDLDYRAEINDIYNCLELGANGLVLASETAIGKWPLECIKIISDVVKTYNKAIKK